MTNIEIAIAELKAAKKRNALKHDGAYERKDWFECVKAGNVAWALTVALDERRAHAKRTMVL